MDPPPASLPVARRGARLDFLIVLIISLLATANAAQVEALDAPVATPPASASKKELLAEAIGTGLIVLLGTGTVASAVYTGAHQGIWQIAATWGGAVALAAYTTAGVSVRVGFSG